MPISLRSIPTLVHLDIPSANQLLRWTSVLVSVLLLLMPALINGYPFIFPDTAQYINQGLRFEITLPFAMGYALFIRPFVQIGELWPVIFIQALLIVITIRQLCVSFSNIISDLDIIYIIAFSTVATTLPWSVGWIQPDIFVGLMILSLATIVSFHFGQSKRSWHAMIIAVVCSVMHSVSILVLLFTAGTILMMVVVASFSSRNLRRNLTPLARSLGVVIALGVGANLSINLAVHKRASILTPYGWGNALFSLNQSGLVSRFLNLNCDSEYYRLCPFKDSLPRDPDHFLWASDSPFNTFGGFKGMEDESRRIVIGVVKQQPFNVARHALHNFIDQLSQFDVRTEMLRAMQNPGVLRLLEIDGVHGLNDYRVALQHTGQFPSNIIVLIHYFCLFFSMAIIIFMISFDRDYIRFAQLSVLGTILLGIAANDLFSAAITYPQDRFEARVIWLLPAFIVLSAFSRVKEAARAKPI